jgi:carbon storage regulator
MLVLSRKAGESIYIDTTIKVTIVSVSGNRVKVGIEAPEEVKILRSELQDTQERSEVRFAEIDCDARMNRDLCSC